MIRKLTLLDLVPARSGTSCQYHPTQRSALVGRVTPCAPRLRSVPRRARSDAPYPPVARAGGSGKVRPARSAFPGTRICALLLTCCWPLLAAEPGQTAQAKPAQDAEAAYTRTIEKRVADILAVLDLNDPARSAKAHDLLIAQYRALRDWHDANDAKLKRASPDQAAQIRLPLKARHGKFLASLSEVLKPSQVDRVKDLMTYGKVKVTYDAYCEIVPNLTEAQKTRILDLLKEAREEAMDAGSSDEKSAVFKKYKGKINNYLTAEGHDVKQAYKDWGEKQKSQTAPPAPKTQKSTTQITPAMPDGKARAAKSSGAGTRQWERGSQENGPING